MGEPPKGIDPKVWEMALGVAEPINPGTILYGIIAEAAAKTISQAIEAERGEIAEALEKIKIEFLSPSYASNQPFGSITERFAIDECIREVRNRSNTTTERNEG